MSLSGRAAIAGVLGAVWLALAAAGGLGIAELLGSLVALVLGALVTVGWTRAGDTARRILERTEDWLELEPGEAFGSGSASGSEPGARAAAAPGGPVGVSTGTARAGNRTRAFAAAEVDVAAVAVEEVLATLAEQLHARRLVVWQVDPQDDVIDPVHALGPAPRPQKATGDPLTWAAREASSMRLDPAPSWSRGEVVAAPIDGQRVLSVEAAPGHGPEPERLAPGCRTLAALLSLVDREIDARTQRERLDRVVGFLQGLSRETDPGLAPDALARAALDLVGARGAIVASWSGDRGTILVRHGGGRGPRAGQEFDLGQGDLAHAARIGVPLRRSPGDSGQTPPLVDGNEGWTRPPPYRVVIPLLEPDGAVAGLVAAWGDRRPEEQGVRLLEALGPLLGLQLRQATDLARFRDRATFDALTRLPNRAAFDERLEEEQARFHRYRRPVALMVIDLDHFKEVNDTHGHPAGDAVLRRVGELVRGAVRDVDVPARYGGEEIAVLMSETMLRAAQDVAERVRTAIAAAEVRHDGRAIPITASIGVSGCPEIVDDPAALFESADAALYRAKQGGRNRVVVAERE